MRAAVAAGLLSSVGSALARQPRPDPELEPREIRYVPFEIVVFPHDPLHSPAIAERMREDGFVILGRGAVSGMILAVTAPVPGIEEVMCEYLRLWPEVKAAERSVAGDALGMRPEVCPRRSARTRATTALSRSQRGRSRSGVGRHRRGIRTIRRSVTSGGCTMPGRMSWT